VRAGRDAENEVGAMRRLIKFSSSFVLIGVTFFALASPPARAAELVMFEQAGCPWCARFDRDIAPIYKKTEEGLRTPLRRVDIDRPIPPDLALLQVVRFTPVFVLVDKGREIGRIRGYPGEESFWMQLAVLFQKLDAAGTGGERARNSEKPMRSAA
jgi:hypothetical protein